VLSNSVKRTKTFERLHAQSYAARLKVMLDLNSMDISIYESNINLPSMHENFTLANYEINLEIYSFTSKEATVDIEIAM
jgi:hypothetical protein